MPEFVDGVICQWEKPEKSNGKFDSIGDALMATLDIADTATYLDPKAESDPYYPYIEKVAEEFFSGVAGKLLISSDYDVDGTTSAVILGRAFRALGWDVRVFVPDRFQDSYGVNYGRMDEVMADWHFDQVIAADCGATELVGLAEFGVKNKVKVAVVDHHKRGPIPESGVLEVNPHMHLGNGVVEGGYSTAILATMLIQAAIPFYPALKPILRGCEILAGLSAMADSASMLVPGARYYARQFMEGALTPESGVGVKALLEVAGIKTTPTSTDVNFKVVPMINAAGRLRSAEIIVALFQEEDPTLARDVAEKLQALNKTRRGLQEEVQQQAMAMYRQGDRALIACKKEWHAGVVGPAAGQLADLLGIPVFLGGYIPNKDTFSFSGRTCSNINIHALLTETVKELPVQFGGHKVALGMKVAAKDVACVDILRARLQEKAPVASKQIAKITKVVRARSINFKNWQDMCRLEPFGVDNPAPLFCIPRVTLNMAPLLSVANSCSGRAFDEEKSELPVLIFRNAKLAGTRRFHGHMVGEMVCSTFRNETVIKFIIRDLIPIAT